MPISSTAAARRVRPRSSSNAQPASLSPSVVGSAWTEWVRPIITVLASARARATMHDEQPVAVEEEALAGGPQLERETGVDDVAAGQAEVEVAAVGADRLGDLADEGDDVVVGRPFDLEDAVDVDLGARLDGRERVGRDLAAGGLGAGDRELDPEHGLEPGDVRPDGAHLGEGVARDHRARASAGARADADVVAALEAWEVDGVGGALGDGSGGFEVGAATDDGQDPAAARRPAVGGPGRCRRGRRGRPRRGPRRCR